ncbi:hypothetical protein FAZ95_01210 [Trinickia violacea]|uniref:Uncharacterized protein n=1 Tax=Trinickia violacea TaxID=2571746 RepID=A0A4P8IH17_9BURK|nr:hypothetical protein [Trinickia violacea]QCP47918.1 hypothetical protein FAZ95_01210 [Trinickia violacea]
MDNDYDEVNIYSEEPPVCPYCDELGSCPHLLLNVEVTFRTVESGVLFDAFNARLLSAAEQNGGNPSCDGSDRFDQLLSEVDELADAVRYWTFEDGPGMSSNFQLYYAESPERTMKALERLSAPI